MAIKIGNGMKLNTAVPQLCHPFLTVGFVLVDQRGCSQSMTKRLIFSRTIFPSSHLLQSVVVSGFLHGQKSQLHSRLKDPPPPGFVER